METHRVWTFRHRPAAKRCKAVSFKRPSVYRKISETVNNNCSTSTQSLHCRKSWIHYNGVIPCSSSSSPTPLVNSETCSHDDNFTPPLPVQSHIPCHMEYKVKRLNICLDHWQPGGCWPSSTRQCVQMQIHCKMRRNNNSFSQDLWNVLIGNKKYLLNLLQTSKVKYVYSLTMSREHTIGQAVEYFIPLHFCHFCDTEDMWAPNVLLQ